MSESVKAEQALCYVDAILYHFIENNLPASFKLKALAVMSTAYLHAGGYNRNSGLSIGQIAKRINISDTALSKVVSILEETHMIRREQAPGRGNRLVITPLAPDQWKLPDGEKVSDLEEGQQHLDGQSDNNKTVEDQITNSYVIGMFDVYQEKWLPIFKKIKSHVEENERISSYEPFRLLAVMATIAEYSPGPGYPCTINARRISQILRSNETSMTNALKHLESIGVIKRKWTKRRKIITPILPD